MDHNDISYIHRDDEKALLRSVLDGSLSEDIYISNLIQSKSAFPAYSFYGNNATRKRKLFMNVMTSTESTLQYFCKYSKNIDSVHVVINAATSMAVTNTQAFQGCPDLEHAEIEFGSNITTGSLSDMFLDCPVLKTCVFRHHNPNGTMPLSNTLFGGGGNTLDTLVLDAPFICTMSGVAAMNNTKFKNGGAGGTIYIPESLYNHLGDGTALDYKSATNWSTLDGYGTVTWAKIEGSEYEQ